MMKWMISAVALGTVLVGCGSGGGSAAAPKEVPTDHDQFAQTAQGRENLRSGTGLRTTELESPDFESFGLRVFPGAEPGEDKKAYQSEGERADSTRYTVYSSKPVSEVAKFYEEELGAPASILRSDEALVSGKRGDEFGAVVTILRTKDDLTEIQVEILHPVGK